MDVDQLPLNELENPFCNCFTLIKELGFSFELEEKNALSVRRNILFQVV